jgi:glycosyltransferase involved in cell wall biosynthesis
MTSQEEIGLTVVIACLNSEGTIGAQLEALAEQQCPVSWELLVCDNGSTDGTAQVAQRCLERYGERLPLVLLDASVRRGAGSARNLGAAHARGRWLAFCDADDVVADDWLAQMCSALERYSFVGGRFEGERLNSARTLRSRSLDQQEGLQNSPAVTALPHAGAGNMGIHRELFARIGGFDPTVPCLEDTDLSWRVQQLGVVLHYVPEVVVHVRLRSARRDMYRQGLAYGQAHALLEHRHGDLHHGADDGVRIVASTGFRGPRALLSAWLGQRPSIGRLVWQLGWHRGYHEAVKGRQWDRLSSQDVSGARARTLP